MGKKLKGEKTKCLSKVLGHHEQQKQQKSLCNSARVLSAEYHISMPIQLG